MLKHLKFYLLQDDFIHIYICIFIISIFISKIIQYLYVYLVFVVVLSHWIVLFQIIFEEGFVVRNGVHGHDRYRSAARIYGIAVKEHSDKDIVSACDTQNRHHTGRRSPRSCPCPTVLWPWSPSSLSHETSHPSNNTPNSSTFETGTWMKTMQQGIWHLDLSFRNQKKCNNSLRVVV